MTSYLIAGLVVAVVVLICVGRAFDCCLSSPLYAVRQRRQMLAELRRQGRR